ncbi:MAG: hypothetical protein ACLROI_12650 [Beduini sp.]|uniref:hypothetical protein n=1 Tax=Beduini sp. TaxID=1922300 RepID=UPI003990E018
MKTTLTKQELKDEIIINLNKTSKNHLKQLYETSVILEKMSNSTSNFTDEDLSMYLSINCILRMKDNRRLNMITKLIMSMCFGK